MESHEWKRRLEEVTQLAESVFEDQHQAARWLNAPHPALGGAIPALHCETEKGAREVRRILRSINDGGVV